MTMKQVVKIGLIGLSLIVIGLFHYHSQKVPQTLAQTPPAEISCRGWTTNTTSNYIYTSDTPSKIHKVGIGNKAPTERLDVTGNIKASGNITAAGQLTTGNITSSGNIASTGNITSGGVIQGSSLKITSGTADVGNILTLDGTGVGTWQPMPAIKINATIQTITCTANAACDCPSGSYMIGVTPVLGWYEDVSTVTQVRCRTF